MLSDHDFIPDLGTELRDGCVHGLWKAHSSHNFYGAGISYNRFFGPESWVCPTIEEALVGGVDRDQV